MVLVVVAAALFAGLWLDNALNTKPVFTLLLVIGSVPLSIYLMYRVAMGIIARSDPRPKTINAVPGDKQP